MLILCVPLWLLLGHWARLGAGCSRVKGLELSPGEAKLKGLWLLA